MDAKLNVGQESVLTANKANHSLGSIRKYVANKSRDTLIPRYVTQLRQRVQYCCPALGLSVNKDDRKTIEAPVKGS